MPSQIGRTFAVGVASAVLQVAGGLLAEEVTAPEPRVTEFVRVVERASPSAVDIAGVKTRADGQPEHYVGSGAIIHPAGYILTNDHVVGEGRVTAHLDDGTSFPCRVVGRSPGIDLAVLKIDANRSFPALALGLSRDLRLGEPAILIGNPNGLTHTVSTGIVSRLAAGFDQTGHIQTTAPVNGGNSGGPLLNARGELVGIVNAKIGGEALGLAIPVDRARAELPAMLLDEMVRGYRCGFAADPFAPEARITAVAPGSPAEAAGLLVGDLVRQVGGVAVGDGVTFHLVAGDRDPAAALDLEVDRAGTVVAIRIVPEAILLAAAVAEGRFDRGLRYQIFHGEWATLPDFATLEPVDSGWSNGFSHTVPGARNESIGLAFQGYVHAPADGLYTFATVSDDGSRLWIDDAVVVNNDGLHGAVEKKGRVRLAAGKHRIAVAYFERGGAEGLQVFWEGPDLPRQEIPAGALFVDAAGR